MTYPTWTKEREVSEEDVRMLRAYWHAAAPHPDDAATIRPRDLRFARAGGLDGDAWHRQLAALLNGDLDAGRAPCVRYQRDEVRSVHRTRVDWTQLAAGDRRALRAMGLRRDAEATLGAPVDIEPQPRGRGRPALGDDTERLSVSVSGAQARRWRALAARLGRPVADVIREATDARCDAEGVPRE